jgi:hypothetical protein
MQVLFNPDVSSHNALCATAHYSNEAWPGGTATEAATTSG